MFGRFMTLNVLVLSALVYSSGATAQKQNAKIEKLFEDFMRRGDLPLEFKVKVYRTSPRGLGAHLGTIIARNTMIEIAGRQEPALILKAKLADLAPGPHAFHIHEFPDCGPKEKDGVMVPGLAAGGHLFAGHQDGTHMVTYKSHLGNLPNLVVNTDGASSEEVIAPRLALADLINRSIVVHASQDDGSAREACGVFN
jgi:Cu-Zn family superoxide dismutase